MDLLFTMSPLLVVALGALLLMLAEAFSRKAKSAELALVATATLLGAAGLSICVFLASPDTLASSQLVAPYLIDRSLRDVLRLRHLPRRRDGGAPGGRVPARARLRADRVLPAAPAVRGGAMMLAGAGDLLSTFIGLETMSLGVYAMTGFRRGSPRSVEAAMKYFLLGSFAAAVLLYGAALLYGATGHTDLAGIGAMLAAGDAHLSVPLAVAGMMLVLGGLAFKVSAVPFHMWTPDAYEGAPTPATAFMAVVVKAAAFAMMLRVLLVAFGDAGSASWGAGWPPVLAVASMLTMTVANLIAGRQESVKRMLAYSSIAHAGYVLIGVVTASAATAHDAQASVLFYLLAYTVSTAGAFGALVLCGRKGAEATSYDDLAGLGRRHPALALAFSLFLLSLAGVPPTAGFFGKFYVFRAAIGAAGGVPWMYALAVVGLLNSVVGAYYYLRVLVFMYMREPAEGAPVAVPMKSTYVVCALVACALLVLALGVAPGSSLEFALSAPASGL